MFKKTTRVPRAFKWFDPYYGVITVYLTEDYPGGIISRGEHIGMTPGQVTALGNHYAKWRTGDPANPGAYEIHLINPKAIGGTRATLLEFQGDFITFITPIYDVINVNPNTSDEDRTILNIAIPNAPHSHPTNPFTAAVYVRPIPMTDFRIKLKCFTSDDASRPSLIEGADCLEIAYRRDPIELEVDPVTHLPIPGKIKRRPITAPTDGTTIIHFTTASPLWKIEGASVGDYLQFYVRWANTKHPNLAGPWTGPTAIPL